MAAWLPIALLSLKVDLELTLQAPRLPQEGCPHDEGSLELQTFAIPEGEEPTGGIRVLMELSCPSCDCLFVSEARLSPDGLTV